MSVEDVVFTLDHLQDRLFTIDDEDHASILEYQNIFYGGLERKSIVEISTGLDSLAHRVMLYLGKALQLNFSFKEQNQVVKMAQRIKAKFSEEAVGSFFADGFKHMETIQSRYHALAHGKTLTKEQEARSDFDSWLEKAQDDFETFWEHFDAWFQNDLYISQYDWERRRKHGVLADLFAQKSSIEDLEEGIEALKSKDLERISAKSIRDYVHFLQEDGEYQKAEFLLWKFEDKFSRTNEDVFKLHQLRAHLKLGQKEYAQALQEFEIALSKAGIYGQWDRRYTTVMSEILILKTRLDIAHDEEVLIKFEKKAKYFSDESLLEWCQFSFINRYDASKIDTEEGFTSFIGNILLDNDGFSLSPRRRIRFLQWVDDYIVETEKTETHAALARKTLLNMIIDIAKEYARWSVLSAAYNSLIEIAEDDGENLFYLRELKNKQNAIDNELDILDEIYNTGEVAIKEKNATGIESLKSYHQHCVQQNYTQAVEHLSELNYWLSRSDTYEKLDEYNGPFNTLFRIISTMKSGKFRAIRKNREFNFTAFRENLLERACAAGTPWAEAIALDAIIKTGEWFRLYSDAQKLADLDRIIDLEKQMGAKKLCTVFKQKKAELLEKMNEREKSLELYEEVISEFMEIEPLSAFFTYARMVKKQNLWVNQPSDVIQRCEIIKARLERNNYDRMEFDSLQALAMVCESTKYDLTDAKNHLEESFNIVISKPFVNDKNYAKYGGVVSAYLLIDVLVNDQISQDIIDKIENESQFSSLYCLFWCGIELRKLANVEAFNVIDKIEMIADYLNDHGQTHFGLQLLNLISKHHFHNGNHVEADRYRRKSIELSLERGELTHLGRGIRYYQNNEDFTLFIKENDLLQKLQSMKPSSDKTILLLTLGRKLGTEGLPFYIEALRSAEETDDKGKKSVILYRIARLTESEADVVRAVDFLTKTKKKAQTKFDPGIVGRVIHLLGKHPTRIIPKNQASKLIRLYFETYSSNMKFLDYYQLSQLSKVRWIMRKYGENDHGWRRTIVEMFQAFATQSHETKNPVIALKFIEVAENHAKMSMNEKNDAETGPRLSADIRIWLEAILLIEELTPGVFHRKLYNHLWMTIEDLHGLNKEEGEVLSKVFVDHLQENENRLNPRFAPESKIQRAEAYMLLGNPANVCQLLNDIGDWLAAPNNTLSKPSTITKLLLIFSDMFDLHSQEHPELTDAMFKTIDSRTYRYHKKREPQITKTLVTIVEQNLEQFLIARSPLMPAELEQIVIQVSDEHRNNEFEAKNILSKFVNKTASKTMENEAIVFHFKNKTALDFISNLIKLSADMVPANKERHGVLVSFFNTIYAWNKGEGKTKADLLRWEKIEDKLNSAIVASIESDDFTDETEQTTLLVQQATRAYNIPRLRKNSAKFLINSICSEDPKRIIRVRDEAYLQWITKIFRTNTKLFNKLRVELTLDFERLLLVNRYAKLAHSKGYKALPKKLYHDVLTAADCSQKMEAYTYYRIACLEDDYNVGKKSLMALILDKEEEKQSAWVNRILLSMYIIKHEGITEGVEAIVKLVLRSANVKIVVEKEMEITEHGDIKLDGEIQKCSGELRKIFTSKKNHSVKYYNSGVGNGNDIAYLSLDENDDTITKILVLQNKPHIETTE